VFAGHQTFHPRFGWIKKAFDGVGQDRNIFSREDSTVLWFINAAAFFFENARVPAIY
jgi:hypothetical protein